MRRCLIDGHMHMMAFEFIGGRIHCGRPWHPYGSPYALTDCPDHYPNGAGAVAENVLSDDNPAHLHDPVTQWREALPVRDKRFYQASAGERT